MLDTVSVIGAVVVVVVVVVVQSKVSNQLRCVEGLLLAFLIGFRVLISRYKKYEPI